MAIIQVSSISKHHIIVDKLPDLDSGTGDAANFVIGTTAYVVEEESNWICELDTVTNRHFWKFLSASLFFESRMTWAVAAEPLISGNAPTANMRNRYPMLPTRNFSSNQLVSKTTLELDVSGGGSFVPLEYGVDYGLLPRTPELIAAPGIGIGFGLQSRAYGAGGPRSSVSDQAVGFAVTQDIAATLSTSSQFRFSWTERTLSVQAVGAKAAVVETTRPFTDEPSFSEAYAVAHANNSTGSFPNMPKQYSVGQFGVFFNSVANTQIEVWRRSYRTNGGAYRDRSSRQVGLRRMSTGLTLLDRARTDVFFGTALDIFSSNWSHQVEYHWCYWSESLQARSPFSDLPIFRASLRWLTTNTPQSTFRAGNVFWIGLR